MKLLLECGCKMQGMCEQIFGLEGMRISLSCCESGDQELGTNQPTPLKICR